MPRGYHKDGRPVGRKEVMNVVLGADEFGNARVSWTCPKCNHRNERKVWYGREDHVCESCGESTNVKGPSAPGRSVAIPPRGV